MGLLRDDHIYSYSQLSSVSQCPYEFYLSRIEKEDQVENAFAQQGSLIHELIDDWAKGKVKAEDLVSEYEKRYPEAVTVAFPRMLATKGYTEKAYNLGIEYFTNFDMFEGYTVIGTETKFNTDIAGRPFVGIVDMILEDNATKELIVLDHKSKSLREFKKHEDEMYKQQLIYSKYVYENFGRFPDRLMFNLFKENGLKQERKFSIEDYNEALAWAERMIERIEEYDVFQWMDSKEQDFYCTEICSVRKHCPNGISKRKHSK